MEQGALPCEVDLSSKPTVWDCDLAGHNIERLKEFGSKPTGWDGDIFAFIVVLPALLCSKPTVWDGDMEVSYSPPLGGSFGSKPTVWDSVGK